VVSGAAISGAAVVAAGGLVSVETADGAGLAKVALVGVTASFDPEASCARRKSAVGSVPDWLSASLGQGSSIQAAHPAIAIVGSTMRRASALPNDRPAIRIAAPSSGGAGDCRAAHEKKPYGRYTVRLFSRLPLYGSAAFDSTTQGYKSCRSPRQYCGSRAALLGMELQIWRR